MKILILGASGLIGGHLAATCQAGGLTVFGAGWGVLAAGGMAAIGLARHGRRGGGRPATGVLKNCGARSAFPPAVACWWCTG
ncbi:hypothetical protein AAKU55_003755 [Oxalobacteraceae bacterium GrIS 1.11]